MKDKDNNNNISPQADEEEKIHVSKSVFRSAKELQQQRMNELEEQQRQLEKQAQEREKKKREAYERRILQEKKELLRMKQEQTEESEIIDTKPEEEVKLSSWKKITNFFYHNKWWLGLAVFFVCAGAFLIYDLVSREKPDLTVMIVAENDIIGNSEGLKNYLEGFAEDSNGDGKVNVAIHYIPYSDNYRNNYANGIDTKLTVEFQSADAMIVIGNSKLYNIMRADQVFVNLEELMPDNKHTDSIAFKLKDTSFAEKISVTEEAVTDDLFICLRIPQSLMYTDEEEMQEAYDRDFPIFNKIIEDLSE